VQKLFENFRRFINEADDPDSDSDDAAELRNMAADLEQAELPQLKHIKISKLSDGRLQGVWSVSLDNLMDAEDDGWLPDPDKVDQLESSFERQARETEDEQTKVYWYPDYGDEDQYGAATPREGFILRMHDYDRQIEANLYAKTI